MAGADEIARMFAQCLADPEDDEPRLVWADAIGGERGELVVVQCDLARHQRQPELAPHEVAARRRRERELLARHGAAWSGLADLATGWTFHRGFVEAARFDLDTIANDPAAPFAAAPLLRGISIANLAGPIDPDSRRVERPRVVADALGRLARTLASPALAKLRALDVIRPSAWNDTGDRPSMWPIQNDVAALLAAYGALPELRALGIAGQLGQRGAEALGALAQHVRLERLWLRDQFLEAEHLTSLLARFPHIVALDITARNHPMHLDRIAPLLERPLVSLAVDDPPPEALAALVRAPAGRTLEHLAIGRSRATPDMLALLDELPRLRALEVAFPHDVSDDALRALAELRLPALRELAIGSYATAFTLGEIAGSFGDRLEVLDLRGTHVAHGPVLPGDVLVDDVAPVALLHPTAPVQLAGAHRASYNQLLGAAGPQAFLVSLTGQVWEIPATDVVFVGRVSGMDIAIVDQSVSRHHCDLRWHDGAHHISDYASTVGTFVDGVRADAPIRLHDGATVHVGGVALRYYVGPAARERTKRWIVEPRTTRP